MDKEYKALERRALEGDSAAIRELFRYGEKQNKEKNYSEAATAYRDAAIAYRISASRNLERAEDAERRVRWSTFKEEIYQNWIKDNPNGLRDLPFPESWISKECIRNIVVEELLDDDLFSQYFYYLQVVLSEMGVRFYSPGGSIQRRVIGLLAEYFDPDRRYSYAKTIEVRVGLDPLADEVVKRCKKIQQH